MADDAMLLSLLLNATAALSDDEKGKRLLEIKQEGDKLRELNAATQMLLDNNQAAGLCNRAQNGVAVERYQGAGVDDLDRNALLRRRCGRRVLSETHTITGARVRTRMTHSS